MGIFRQFREEAAASKQRARVRDGLLPAAEDYRALVGGEPEREHSVRLAASIAAVLQQFWAVKGLADERHGKAYALDPMRAVETLQTVAESALLLDTRPSLAWSREALDARLEEPFLRHWLHLTSPARTNLAEMKERHEIPWTEATETEAAAARAAMRRLYPTLVERYTTIWRRHDDGDADAGGDALSLARELAVHLREASEATGEQRAYAEELLYALQLTALVFQSLVLIAADDDAFGVFMEPELLATCVWERPLMPALLA